MCWQYEQTYHFPTWRSEQLDLPFLYPFPPIADLTFARNSCRQRYGYDAHVPAEPCAPDDAAAAPTVHWHNRREPRESRAGRAWGYGVAAFEHTRSDELCYGDVAYARCGEGREDA